MRKTLNFTISIEMPVNDNISAEYIYDVLEAELYQELMDNRWKINIVQENDND